MRQREMEWARVMRLVRDGAEAGSRRVWREVGVVLGRPGLVLGWDGNMSYKIGLGEIGKALSATYSGGTSMGFW